MILIPFPDLQRTPRELKWQLLSNTQGFNGSPEQVSELAGARWAAQFEYNLNLMSRHDARKLKAFLTKLRGRAGRFTLHNMARPEPRGDGRFYAASSNLLQHSEAMNNAIWTKGATTIGQDVTLAPDGSLTAEKVIENTANSLHTITQTPLSASIGVTYRKRTHLKAAGRGFAFVGFNGAAVAFISVNLSTGAVSVAAGTPIDYSVTALADGWFKVVMGATTTLAANLQDDVRVSYDGNWANRSYLGNGSDGIYIWGSQLNVGALTGYVPTTTAAITNRLGPYVYGAGQTGNSLVVWGWQESITGILKAGDFFSVNGELKMVTADANTDALGRTTLQFEPPLRSAPPDLAQVTVDQPTGTFMLTEDIVQWSTNGPGLVNIPISCIEAI
jgi:hypothetical protein